MALLQALLALIGRSAGRIVNALFGWAVRALFGFVSGAEKALLTGVVAVAALWPLLAIGIAAPRVASFLVAFAPIPDGFPDAVLRAVWLGVALFAPALLGLALAARAPEDAPRESFWTRTLRGYPITLGLALAFWLSFVTVPVQRIGAVLRRRTEVYVPLMTVESAYAATARRVEDTLSAHGFAAVRAEPGFWSGLPTRILGALGGRTLARHVPRDVAYLRGPDLEATLYPAGLLLRGGEQRIALAHGLVVEALANSEALQTTTPEAQAIERKIHRIWRVLDRHPAHVGSRVLAQRLEEIAGEIAALEIDYDDWQTLYRQALQLGRALGGAPQLLAELASGGETTMQDEKPDITESTDVQAAHELSTVALMRELTGKAFALVRKELELARAEVKQDFDAELATVKALGVAAVLGIASLTLLLVAAALGLASIMPAWGAALVVAGATALAAGIAGAIGWSRRVTRPLDTTRKTLEDDVEWAKERLS